MCAQCSAEAGALRVALAAADRAVEAYDVLLALAETTPQVLIQFHKENFGVILVEISLRVKTVTKFSLFNAFNNYLMDVFNNPKACVYIVR